MLAVAFMASFVNASLVLLWHKSIPVLASYILEPFAFASVFVYTYFNHTRTRSSSTVLLLFWPLYIVAIAVWCRTLLTKQVHLDSTLFILKLVTLVTGVISYVLECMGTELGLPPSDKLYQENPELTANVYSIWVWSLLLFLYLCV